MIGPLGRLGAAATLGQYCPQMTQRPGNSKRKNLIVNLKTELLNNFNMCRDSLFLFTLEISKKEGKM